MNVAATVIFPKTPGNFGNFSFIVPPCEMSLPPSAAAASGRRAIDPASAVPEPQLGEDAFRRTEPGEPGLEQIGAHENRQKQPPRTDPMRQGQAEQNQAPGHDVHRGLA